MIAGALSGGISTAAFFPLDVVKTRLQVQVQPRSGSAPQTAWREPYRGALDALYRVAKEEGYSALFRGLSPSLLGAALSWGGYFFFFERAKRRRHADLPDGTARVSTADYLLCGVEAGVLTLAFTNPLWLIKTRLQIQTERALGPPPYRGIWRECSPFALLSSVCASQTR